MDQTRRKQNAIRRELAAVARKEKHLGAAARRKTPPAWKTRLEQMVPEKLYGSLQAAFCKSFSLVFHQGRRIIEKSYSRQNLENGHQIRDFTFRLTGKRKDFKKLRKAAGQGSFQNMAVTTAEGVGLGLLGIGLPDIVLFLATLLRGLYELALSYGFAYDSRWEQLLILKILEASLSTGEVWDSRNEEVDRMLEASPEEVSREVWQQQLERTASTFAVDMLLLKFIQGLPLVGFLGGAANPFYYRRVTRYAELKYRKRYLLLLSLGKEPPVPDPGWQKTEPSVTEEGTGETETEAASGDSEAAGASETFRDSKISEASGTSGESEISEASADLPTPQL